jgi:hypothetical protein
MAIRADITITIDGDALGLLVGATLGLSLGLVEAAAEYEYGYAEHLPALRSWQAEGSLFVPFRGTGDAYEALMTAFHTRTAVTVAYDMAGATETGSAVLSACQIQAAVGGLLEGTISLLGAGVLTAS